MWRKKYSWEIEIEESADYMATSELPMGPQLEQIHGEIRDLFRALSYVVFSDGRPAMLLPPTASPSAAALSTAEAAPLTAVPSTVARLPPPPSL